MLMTSISLIVLFFATQGHVVASDSFTVFTNTSSAGFVDLDFTDTSTSAIVFGTQCQIGPIIGLTKLKGASMPPDCVITSWNTPPQFTIIKFSGSDMINDYQLMNLSSAYTTWFWIAWPNAEFFLGMGKVVGQNTQMYFNYSSPIQINRAFYRSMHLLQCYFTFINETFSKDFVSASASGMNMQEIYAGDVPITCEAGVVPGPTFTTDELSQLIDLGVDLSTTTSCSLSVQSCSGITARVTLYDKNVPNPTLASYAFDLNVFITIYKTGTQIMYSSGIAVVTCNILVFYWMSWEGGFLTAGLGNIIGTNKIVYWRDPSPSFQVNCISISSSANVTSSIPNRYFLTKIARQQDSMLVSKKTTDAYVTGCSLGVTPLAQCSGVNCSNLCAQNPSCTSFNLRGGTSTGGCSCELQRFSSTPWAPSAQVDEQGASHWECG